jgi:hypothetical protein
MTKKPIIIGISITLILITGFVFYTVNQVKTPPQEDHNSISIDSGELDEGVTTEVDPDNSFTYDEAYNPNGRVHNITLYGVPYLREYVYKSLGSVGSIHNDIASALLQYGSDYLKEEYNTLAIDKPSLSIKDGFTLQGSFTLGNSGKKNNFSASIIVKTTEKPARALVTIKNSDTVFTYVGGLQNVHNDNFSIKQPIKSSPSIEISTNNTELSLEYIKSIGYEVPDLEIIFKDYRNPFE